MQLKLEEDDDLTYSIKCDVVVLSAKTQVVAGMNYDLQIELKDSKSNLIKCHLGSELDQHSARNSMLVLWLFFDDR